MERLTADEILNLIDRAATVEELLGAVRGQKLGGELSRQFNAKMKALKAKEKKAS